MPTLSVSIVTFLSDPLEVQHTLGSLAVAIRHAQQAGKLDQCQVVLVDNGGSLALRTRYAQLLEAIRRPGTATTLLTATRNGGYGTGNNLALRQVESDFHLILNPDVELEESCLHEALKCLAEHPDAVLLTPRARDPAGITQFVAKGMPGVLTLLARALPGLPTSWRDALGNRRYELRDGLSAQSVLSGAVAGGCFMLCRTAALRQIQGFDERYFMYFEDFDLSMRLSTRGALVYCDRAHIVHGGGGAARKGWRHQFWFARSAFRFFNRYGWRWMS